MDNFLWGNIREYSLSSDGTLAFNPGGGPVSADIKLDLLIKWTRQLRELCCPHPLYVLNEPELKIVLDEWKNAYEQWMHPQTVLRCYSYRQQKWHQALRTSFRTFLFHLMGCY